jgi:hypothetical protein
MRFCRGPRRCWAPWGACGIGLEAGGEECASRALARHLCRLGHLAAALRARFFRQLQRNTLRSHAIRPLASPLRSLHSIPLHFNPLTFPLGRKSYTSIPGYYFSYAQPHFHPSNPTPTTAIMNGTTTNGNGHLNASKVRFYRPNFMMTRLHTDQFIRTRFCSLQSPSVKAIPTRSGE